MSVKILTKTEGSVYFLCVVITQLQLELLAPQHKMQCFSKKRKEKNGFLTFIILTVPDDKRRLVASLVHVEALHFQQQLQKQSKSLCHS